MFFIPHLKIALLLTCGLVTSATWVPVSADDPIDPTQREQELIAVLRSDSPAADKAIACKNLAIYGSANAVSDLAMLLPNAQLSSWARIALEAIPDQAADAALRSAMTELSGQLLVGTINSIGIRRDADSVPQLIIRLQDSDAEVASAAAVALGLIGNDDAASALQQALASAPAAVRSAVAEGCVLCAEKFWTEGNLPAAIALYDEVRKSDVPRQRILEATRGAILARSQDGIPLLLEQFQSSEKAMFQLALSTAREFPGREIDSQLVSVLESAPTERAALIVQIMADRPETVALAAILKAAQNGDKIVRLSAIDALQRVGDESCLQTLLEIAVDNDPELADAARATLADLPSERVNARIVSLLPEVTGKSYSLLIDLVGQRRIDAVPELLKALDHSDQSVRNAALVALGETVSLKRLPLLIAQVTSPKNASDSEVAQLALKTASIRMPDREACAEALAAALPTSMPTTKIVLLEILSEVGGTSALSSLAAAAKSNDPLLQDAGSRLLGKWNSVDAAPVLLDLAKSAASEKYQVRALRGYIGLARKFAMPESQRVEMCKNAFEIARQTAEKSLALEVLKIHPSTEGLQMAIRSMQVAETKEAATQATLLIAQKLASQKIDVRSLLADAGFDNIKLEIEKAEYGAGSIRKDVTALLRKQAGTLPLIALESTNYNTSFGGDPAPGSVKQLTIQYRINGKPGTASFPENAIIILPMPK